MSNDNSSSARAARAKLQAELAEAQANLEDTYYNRSVENQQDALDKELENFQDTKDKEIKNWEEYLEDTEAVVADSLATIQSNTDVVYQTLTEIGQEYGLSITESLTSPWQKGENAIQSFSEKFGISMSATVDELRQLEIEFKQTMLEIEKAGVEAVESVKKSADKYAEAEYVKPKEETPPKEEPEKEEKPVKTMPSIGDTVVIKKGTTRWGSRSSNVKMASWVPGTDGITVARVEAADGKHSKDQVRVKRKGVIIGWANVSDLEGYAKGTTGVNKDQLALIDELGEELVMHAGQNGKLEYLTKGSAVVPADLTSNLMEWSAIDPQHVLEQNRPSIVVPQNIRNTEIKIDSSIGTLMHIDEFNGDDPDEVLKMINKALDQHNKNLNNALRRYTR